MSAGGGGAGGIRVLAPAKINLVLRVVGRRADGYHLLETWMQKIPLYDVLTFRLLEYAGVELTTSGTGVPGGSENLAYRAAELFLQRSRRASGRGVAVELRKNIPVAAGLGGGSSDAGAVLSWLNGSFGDEFGGAELLDMAVGLGADVPFFVSEAQSVLATGVGEKMVPVPAPAECSYLLVNPGFAVSTAAVFRNFALTTSTKNSTLTGSRKLRPEELCPTRLENDLEEVTARMHPCIPEIKAELVEAGAAAALMSGSGPTVFGLFTGAEEKRKDTVERAARRMRRRYGEHVYTAV